MPSKKILLVLNGLLLLGVLIQAAFRDLALEKAYSSDLVNRITGARLQRERKLPYFYYESAGGYRSFTSSTNLEKEDGIASGNTASPFFHELLYPISHLPWNTLSALWLCLEYLMLAGIILMACGLTDSVSGKLLMVNAGIFFTLTGAWKCLAQTGQNYFFIAFLISCIITGLLHKKKSGIIFAGCCALLLVLVRPIAMMIFIPFLFRARTQPVFLITFISGLLLYIVFVCCTPFEKALWIQYSNAIREHVREQRIADAASVPGYVPSSPATGMDASAAAGKKESLNANAMVSSENGNVFVIYRQLLKKQMPSAALYGLFGLSAILLTAAYYYFLKKYGLSLAQTLLFGFILYLLAEVFSPIFRHQYYTVQWLPLILTGLLLVRRWRSTVFFLLLLGLLLNILNTAWIPMRHTLGEMIWFAGLLALSFSPHVNPLPWKQPS
jgi:hypothetical protein